MQNEKKTNIQSIQTEIRLRNGRQPLVIMSNIFIEDLEIRSKLDHIIHGHEHSPQRIQQHQDDSIQTTHTDQHLLLTVKHPTAYTFLVVRTINNRTSIITDNKDRKDEGKHILNLVNVKFF